MMSRMPKSNRARPELKFADVKNFVRQSRTLLLPAGWCNWRDSLLAPEHQLPIDRQLAQLTAGRKRILSPSEVRGRHSIRDWPSHEIAIRFQLSWYAEVDFQDSGAYAAT